MPLASAGNRSKEQAPVTASATKPSWRKVKTATLNTAQAPMNGHNAVDRMRKQVQELSSALDQERKQRAAAENEVSQAQAQMHTANAECDAMRRELREANAVFVSVVQSLEAQLDTSLSRVDPTPPGHSGRSPGPYDAGRKAYLDAATFHRGFDRLSWIERGDPEHQITAASRGAHGARYSVPLQVSSAVLQEQQGRYQQQISRAQGKQIYERAAAAADQECLASLISQCQQADDPSHWACSCLRCQNEPADPLALSRARHGALEARQGNREVAFRQGLRKGIGEVFERHREPSSSS